MADRSRGKRQRLLECRPSPRESSAADTDDDSPYELPSAAPCDSLSGLPAPLVHSVGSLLDDRSLGRFLKVCREISSLFTGTQGEFFWRHRCIHTWRPHPALAPLFTHTPLALPPALTWQSFYASRRSLFRSLTIRLVGFSAADERALRALISSCGGRCVGAGGETASRRRRDECVTHVVVRRCVSAGERGQILTDRPCLVEQWLVDSFHQGRVQPRHHLSCPAKYSRWQCPGQCASPRSTDTAPPALSAPIPETCYALPLFHNFVFCTTGLTTADRRLLASTVQRHGARYCQTLRIHMGDDPQRQTTHLVVAGTPDTKKVTAGRTDPNLFIVTPQFVHLCVKNQDLLSEWFFAVGTAR
ncbi:unnamed protein product [Vitrella brassicaformis CCMP3155]|uniref:BRCT domain-containing protein n=1 Tax=Vitrella brassicaformis (strain CCMP3155) TaxID=1169540 RepID=A0A0G4FVS0_VITBC|nr:unnamed protein product [Vitrella brassicaformis CCMP3155]|mmetsp:Transcript_38597/g.110412  ORF Transcript_38597/g.110412 Transcript_38597/m.110412 type:complete len:359 (+) Transcript_38597:103-1179(+)|eukprot:CEM19267.1 unnamed protein product [Vitrella brassicaformis CCMP3155]